VRETWKSPAILHNFIEVLEQSLHNLISENEQIIVKDFNIFIKNITTSFNTRYSNILNIMNLNHMRTDPTWITTSSSISLDYIVCDTKEKISDTRRSLRCGYVITLIPTILGKGKNELRISWANHSKGVIYEKLKQERKVWKYPRGNEKESIKEGRTIQ
jgi:hypothetical protein